MKLLLQIRTYEEADLSNVFLMTKDGSAESMLMWYEAASLAQVATIKETFEKLQLPPGTLTTEFLPYKHAAPVVQKRAVCKPVTQSMFR